MKLRAIAFNTFKEAVRNKIYYLLIFFGIGFSLISELISLLTVGDKIKVIKDVGLASINFFSVLIAVFTGINLVFKEIEKKTIYYILSKPISRSNFIIGKFLGLAFTLAVALVSMGIIFFLFLLLSTGSFDSRIIIYFVLLYLELLIITSISILFSSFSTPILSSIFTISLYLIGHVVWTFNLFKDKISDPFTKFITYFFYYILPHLEQFNLKNDIILETRLDPNIFFNSILYAFCYISPILILAIIVLNKKEFK